MGSLRIPLTAVRVAGKDRRVRYQLGSRAVTPEDLILGRWKARTRSATNGDVFDGCRLPPGTWRLLAAAHQAGLDLSGPVDRDELSRHIQAIRTRQPKLRGPQVDKWMALIAW